MSRLAGVISLNSSSKRVSSNGKSMKEKEEKCKQAWATRCCDPHTKVLQRQKLDQSFDNICRFRYGRWFLPRVRGLGQNINRPTVMNKLIIIVTLKLFNIMIVRLGTSQKNVSNIYC